MRLRQEAKGTKYSQVDKNSLREHVEESSVSDIQFPSQDAKQARVCEAQKRPKNFLQGEMQLRLPQTSLTIMPGIYVMPRKALLFGKAKMKMYCPIGKE